MGIYATDIKKCSLDILLSRELLLFLIIFSRIVLTLVKVLSFFVHICWIGLKHKEHGGGNKNDRIRKI